MKISGDINVSLMTSSNIDSTTEHSRKIKYFLDFY